MKDLLNKKVSFDSKPLPLDGILDEEEIKTTSKEKLSTHEALIVSKKINEIPICHQIPYRMDVLGTYKFKLFEAPDENTKWMVKMLNTGLSYFAAYKSHTSYWVSENE